MSSPFRLAKYGLGTLAGITVILILAGAALWINVHPWTVALPVVFFLFSLYFFRDPDRRLPEGEDLVLSPADGKVVDIEEVDAPDFMVGPSGQRRRPDQAGPDGETGKVTRVGIFLSIFSCHVNRAPVAGVVRKTEYRRGRFLAAFNEKASAENESNFIGIETDRRLPSGEALKVAVKQISGVIARRIVSVAREGDSLSRGERFGMIKFGSRTELYLPAGSLAELGVKVGDKVRGGSSVIGRLKAAGPGEPEDA